MSEQKKQVLAVANIKGGVGKTTTSLHLAKWLLIANPEKKLLFINASSQLGANCWAKDLGIDYIQETNTELMLSTIDNSNVDIVVIDLPGESESVKDALDVCDRVLIPIQASTLDLTDTLSIIRIIKRKMTIRKDLGVGFFLSLVETNTTSFKQASEYFLKNKIKLLTPISNLQIIRKAPQYGKTVFDMGASGKRAAQDYHKLFQEFTI
ncbi:plasmid partitioning protein ParA (plasmid) [Chondrocystis sp. NIES-4102]|nr:plasmid partitioning protein ParA [Chondrocystis sp. NIES-4102]